MTTMNKHRHTHKLERNGNCSY